MEDIKNWLIMISLVCGIVFSYYGVFALGKKVMLHQVAQQLIEMTKQTYAEGYSDGKNQAQLDCVAKGVIHGRS